MSSRKRGHLALRRRRLSRLLRGSSVNIPSAAYPNAQALGTALSNQLGSYWNLTSQQSNNLFKVSETQAQTIINEIVQGYTIPGYSAQSLYQQLSTYLTAHGLSATNVPPADSPEAVSLGSLFFNGNGKLIGPKLIAALQAGDRAQVWYQIRYASDANDPNGGIEKRRFYESQVFGLDIPGDTFAQAEQDYEMLAENRATILAKETATVIPGCQGSQRVTIPVGIDPNGPNPTSITTSVLVQANSGYDLQSNPTARPRSIQSGANVGAGVQSRSRAGCCCYQRLVFGGIAEYWYPERYDERRLPGAFDRHPHRAGRYRDCRKRFALPFSDDLKPTTDSPNANHILIGPDSATNSNPLWADATLTRRQWAGLAHRRRGQ